MKMRSKLGISSEFDEEKLLEAEEMAKNGKVLDPKQSQALKNNQRDFQRFEQADEKRTQLADKAFHNL